MDRSKRYALMSVSEKTGIVELAKGLVELGFSILSTGGTADELKKAGIEVILVETYTGSPEMMDGRLKTLHPMVHGGILARTEDMGVMDTYGMVSIDIVVVNLYPFEATIAKQGCTFEDAIEKIDIGGPTMLRAAAKNHVRVAAVCDPADYSRLLSEMQRYRGVVPGAFRRMLAYKVFKHTAEYDRAINEYLADKLGFR